eukprot:471724_1
MSLLTSIRTNLSRAMIFLSKWFWLILLIIVAILLSSPQSIQEKTYPSSSSIQTSLSVPILSILNEFIDFMHTYLNTTSIALIKMNSINFESFGEDTHRQQTVYLRSYYSNEPIQAIHNEEVHIFFLNLTSLELLLINYETNNKFIINVDLAQSAQNRWAPLSFISSSHLPKLQTNININTNIINGNKIRIMTINLWNYNYWIKRLDLIDEILHKYKPDIIGLQELRIRARYLVHELMPYEDPQLIHTFQIYTIISQLTYFSESNGAFQWYSSPAMFFKESTPEQYPEHIVGEGLGIISRFPIIHKHKLKLSRDHNDGLDFHQRLLLGITVQINKNSNNHYELLDIYTTHLSLSEKARTRTLPEIGTYINNELDISTNKHHKIGAVLMGDFNCEFDYMNDDILSSSKYNLIDVWKEKGGCKNDNIENNKQKKHKYSYNYKHNHKRIKEEIWNDDIDGMFKTPNTHYLKHVIYN